MRRTALTSLVLLVVLLVACSARQDAPEDEIREWLERGERLVGEEDRRGLIEMISPAYADARGNDRDGLNDRFRLLFLRTDPMTLLTRVEAITVIDGSAAEVKLDVGMAGRDDLSALGYNASAYRFELELVHDGDDWQLISARWGEVGGQLR